MKKPYDAQRDVCGFVAAGDQRYLEAEDRGQPYAAGSRTGADATRKPLNPMWEVRIRIHLRFMVAGHLGLRGVPRAELRRSGRVYHADLGEKRPYLRRSGVWRKRWVHFFDQRIATESSRKSLRLPISAPTPRLIHSTPSAKLKFTPVRWRDLAQTWTLPEGERIPALPEFRPQAKELPIPTALDVHPLQLRLPYQRGTITAMC